MDSAAFSGFVVALLRAQEVQNANPDGALASNGLPGECLASYIGADSDTDLVHSAMFSGSVARLVAQDVRSANPNKGPASNGPLEGSGEVSHKPDGGRFEY